MKKMWRYITIDRHGMYRIVDRFLSRSREIFLKRQ